MIVALDRVRRLTPLPEDGIVGLKLVRHPLIFIGLGMLWGLPAAVIAAWWLMNPGATPWILSAPAVLLGILLFKIQDESCFFLIVTPASIYSFEASSIGTLDEPDRTDRRKVSKFDVDDSLGGLGAMLRMADVRFDTASDQLKLPKALWNAKVRRQFAAMMAHDRV